MRESDIQRDIQVALVREGARLFRNNVGAVKDHRGIPVHFGLCKGSSDLIGWMPDGRFLAVEVKRPGGKMTPEQTGFILAVRMAGGVAFCATSVAEALQEYQRGFSAR